MGIVESPFLMASDTSSYFGPIAGFVALAVGLVMWMLGGRLAKPGYSVCGLLGGGLGAYVISRQFSQDSTVMWWVMLGSIAGFGLGWGLVRVWTAIGCSLLLAVLAPVLHLAGQGESLPPLLRMDTVHHVQHELPQGNATFQDHQAVRLLKQKQRQFHAWWSNLQAGLKLTSVILFGVGAFVGLIAGLIYPDPSAKVGSATAGAGLFLISLQLLCERYIPSISGWFPQTSNVMLILLGLITMAGLLLQWTIFKPKADM
jgi:hypothetical protein